MRMDIYLSKDVFTVMPGFMPGIHVFASR